MFKNRKGKISIGKIGVWIIGGMLVIPFIALARGGGSSGGFHSSSGSFHSSYSGSFSSGSSIHSSPSIGSSGSYHSNSFSSENVDSGSYYSRGVTNVYNSNSGMNFWFYMWLIEHNNDQKYKNDAVSNHEHFPYMIVLDKTAKDYLLVRYTGPNNKTEKVSPQEAQGLAWLKNEINY